MAAEVLSLWLPLVSGLVGLLAGVLAALWAYTKFILERGLLPPVHFYVECTCVGTQGEKKLLEILLHLRNVGTSTLVAADLRVDVRYLADSDIAESFSDPRKSTFGRLTFPGSVKRDIEEKASEIGPAAGKRMGTGGPIDQPGRRPIRHRGFYVVGYDTFVQPGIDQVYSFSTAVPVEARFVLVWSSFKYALSPSPIQKACLWLSRRLGLIQYSLFHVMEPHTTERVFPV